MDVDNRRAAATRDVADAPVGARALENGRCGPRWKGARTHLDRYRAHVLEGNRPATGREFDKHARVVAGLDLHAAELGAWRRASVGKSQLARSDDDWLRAHGGVPHAAGEWRAAVEHGAGRAGLREDRAHRRRAAALPHRV